MAKHDTVHVVSREVQGKWAVEKPKAERASGLFDTKPEAIAFARKLAPEGVIHVHGKNGKLEKLRG